METKKEPRTLDNVRSEYHNLCLQAGNLQYQIHALSQDLETLNLQLRDLNLEAAAIQAAAPKTEEAK